jgi:hypothetical protein
MITVTFAEEAASADVSVLVAGGIVEVFRLIGVYQRMPRSNFTYNPAGTILRHAFPLVASRHDTDVIRHTSAHMRGEPRHHATTVRDDLTL